MVEHAGQAFFQSLRGLAFAATAARQFERLVHGAEMPPPEEFFGRLYQALLAHTLDALGIPATTGAAEWEWRPLFALHREINPGYFTPGEIAAPLRACPPLAPGAREALLAVLAGYFTLRREGFPASYPSRLVSAADTARWCALFPEPLAWRATDILRRAGLYPLGSLGGWRALSRFAEGRFRADESLNGLYRWQAVCGDAAAAAAGATPADPHGLDFLAAAFAGEFVALGLPGTCESIPRCAACPLRAQCRWHGLPAAEAYTPGAVLATLERSGPAQLTTAQLLDATLSAPDEAAPVFGSQPGLPSLRALAEVAPRELQERLGIGRTLLTRLQALFELARRFGDERMEPGTRFRAGEDVYRHFRIRLRELKQEQFLVLLLDLNRRLLGEVLVTQGLLDKSLVHPREVFQQAIHMGAAAVILVHNHPSGNPDPSQQDIEVTRELLQAGRTLGIAVVDHVIVAERGFTSFREKNLMLFP